MPVDSIQVRRQPAHRFRQGPSCSSKASSTTAASSALTANYTYLNEQLALLRDPRRYGSHFRRVTLTDQNR
jgi:hypothetical protein